MSQSIDQERRGALKKMLLGGALLGSAAMFGNVLSFPFSESIVSFAAKDSSKGISYPTSGSPLPKPANVPSTLYIGSTHSGTSSLQLAVIAGIIARNQPQIYMTDNATVDGHVEQSLTKSYGVSFDTSKSINELISMFGPTACGSPAKWIRYNANYSSSSTVGQNDAVDQLNAVRTMCGVYNALPVPAGQNPPISAQSSPMYDISTWGTSVPLYQMVWNLVSSSVTKSWLAINPPSGNSTRLDMTDYIAMSKAFCFQVPLLQLDSAHPTVTSQKNFAATILNVYPTPSAVLGYVGLGEPAGGSNEVDFVSALSGGSNVKNSALAGSSPTAHGGFYYSGSQLMPNMSVNSAFAPFSGKKFPNPAAIPKYNSSQKYIAIIVSQGDCLSWVENTLLNYMLQCQSSGMPIGITMTQVAQWLAPPVVDYYLSNISSTSGLVASGSAGMGYNHITELPNVSQFLTMGAQLGNNVNIKDYFFIDGPGVNPLSSNGAVASQYISGLKSGSMTPRSCWWWSPQAVAPSIIDGTPCFFTALNISETNLSTQAECNTAIGDSINLAKSNFIVMILNTTFPNPSYLKNACQKSYNGVATVQPLSPGTFANLYRSSQGLPQTEVPQI